jgi:diacylglycerol kinase (ATP)
VPPTCRRVEKTTAGARQASLSRMRANDGDGTAGGPARDPSVAKPQANQQRRSTSDGGGAGSADDNPARRLQFYLSHLLFLLKKIISYDYAGAGWTLWQWLQNYIRRRRIARSGDDSSVAASETRPRSGSSVSEPFQPPASLSPSQAKQPKRSLKRGHPAAPIPESPAAASEREIDESDYDDDFDGPVGLPSHILPLHALLEEEKKGDDETSSTRASRHVPTEKSVPQRTAHVTHRRQSSDSTAYHDLDRDSPRSQKTVNKNLLKRISISLRKRDDSDSSLQELEKDVPFLRGGPPALHENALAATEKRALLTDNDGPPVATNSSAAVAIRLLKSADSAFFFETAGSHESLKKMSVDVQVPDRNGYILGDDFLPDSRYTPLLIFVNSRAGPQQGHLLITQLRRLLNPIQVWDLADGGPEGVLESFLVFTRLRILVCGGDGTVSWIVSVLEGMKKKIRPKKWPPIAILPLGTGNDLARIHGWGGGYNNESLLTILEQISESYISLLDIWEVTIDSKHSKKKEIKTFFNYLGVGADAQAALQVHYLRESRPDWFFSRVVNKLWYGVFGAEDLLLSSSVNVRKEIKLLADGVEVSIPSDSQGIIILNIDSYAGGVPLWSHGTKGRSVTVRPLKPPRRSQSMNTLSRHPSLMERVDSLDDMQMLLSEEERIDRVTACDMESSCQDGILEIVSIRGAFHLGQIKVGLSNAQRLCQCREAVITIKNNVPVQVDGEPWRQRPCTLTVRRKQAQAVMLHRSADDGGVETEMSKLLDWAEERRIIDSEVHSILMKEYSRRIESKTRRRRVKEQDNIMHTLKKAISQSAIGNNLQSSHNWQGGIAF